MAHWKLWRPKFGKPRISISLESKIKGHDFYMSVDIEDENDINRMAAQMADVANMLEHKLEFHIKKEEEEC